MKNVIMKELLKLNLTVLLASLIGLLVAFTNNVPLIDIIKFYIFTFVFANLGLLFGIYLNKRELFK